MFPGDNHVHSQWSYDTGAGASMERTCERALEIGLPSVAFTEHVDFTSWDTEGAVPDPPLSVPDRAIVSPLDVEGYLASVDRCRNRFGGLRILTGIETGEPHRFAAGVARILDGGGFTRVLGSLHSVVDGGRLIGVDQLYAEQPAEAVMSHYLAELLGLVRGCDVFEVLAHVDFAVRYWPRDVVYDEKPFEEGFRAVFAELAASGRVLEFNTRSPLATADRLRWWREEGGRALSFGSDAHQPWRVGARFAEAVQIAGAAGFAPSRDPLDFWRC